MPNTLGSLAQYYIHAINNKLNLPQSPQLLGPYILIGYSAGGNIVLEMAKQLEKLKKPVAVLCLDCKSPYFLSKLNRDDFFVWIRKLSESKQIASELGLNYTLPTDFKEKTVHEQIDAMEMDLISKLSQDCLYNERKKTIEIICQIARLIQPLTCEDEEKLKEMPLNTDIILTNDSKNEWGLNTLENIEYAGNFRLG